VLDWQPGFQDSGTELSIYVHSAPRWIPILESGKEQYLRSGFIKENLNFEKSLDLKG
jgi:hypothetical protein